MVSKLNFKKTKYNFVYRITLFYDVIPNYNINTLCLKNTQACSGGYLKK